MQIFMYFAIALSVAGFYWVSSRVILGFFSAACISWIYYCVSMGNFGQTVPFSCALVAFLAGIWATDKEVKRVVLISTMSATSVILWSVPSIFGMVLALGNAHMMIAILFRGEPIAFRALTITATGMFVFAGFHHALGVPTVWPGMVALAALGSLYIHRKALFAEYPAPGFRNAAGDVDLNEEGW